MSRFREQNFLGCSTVAAKEPERAPRLFCCAYKI